VPATAFAARDFPRCGDLDLLYDAFMTFARWARLCLLISFGLGLCQCEALKRSQKEEDDADNSKTQTLLVGTVELVNPEQQYVLVQCSPNVIVQSGAELTCLDATGSTSTVVVTPERKGNFIAADIKEGTPRLKNLVLLIISEESASNPALPPGVSPGAVTPPMSPSIPPLDEAVDSGLPPLDQDPTIEPGSVSIPPGGMSLEPTNAVPAAPDLPPVVE
jgi:hypothetical protein